MLAWLYNFPNVLIIIFFIAFIVSILICIQRLVKRVIPRGDREHEPILRIFVGLAVTLTFLLSFSMNQVMNSNQRIQLMISQEASQLNNLDNLLLRLGYAGVQKIHQDLLAYIESIIEDEWPALKNGIGSERTRRLYASVSDGVYSYVPQTPKEQILYEHAVRLVADIMDSRDQRIQNAQITLNPIFWFTISLVLLATFFTISFMTNALFDAVLSRTYALAMASLIALVFIFDKPFKDDIVNYNPLYKALQTMRVR
ncbi:DUF4239 domain-containing protein [Legionella brunensis]|uniref:DUF4239 domain-containing protein n=1 Tax=Legionella brunensis TaxID=29422 RepID=A0A0W0SMB4_9GAMM|nr:DUF4239 domain-containing protein [Legionella brunensis]KTC84444.1 hypothetical protein Lbru_1312 [Legionella brunensis]